MLILMVGGLTKRGVSDGVGVSGTGRGQGKDKKEETMGRQKLVMMGHLVDGL